MKSQTDPLRKNAVIVCKLDAGNPAHAGLLEKYVGKQRALHLLGWSTSLCCFKENKPVIYRLTDDSSNPECHELYQKAFFTAVLAYLSDITSCELLYIRYPFSSPFFIRFLKKVKLNFPDTHIVIEFPTYPYKKEFTGVKWFKYLVDQYYAGQLHNYADLAATTADVETMYNIPAVTFSHALPALPENYSRSGSEQSVIQILAAGNLFDWFGLDRLIKGMAIELKNSNSLDVYLHIAGTGPMELKLKRSVIDLGLEAYVQFHGALEKKELIALAAKSDIGVGVLGSHRKNLKEHKPLKHRAYLTYRLPFMLSTSDPDFPGHLPFVHYFPQDNSPISIREIKLFFENSKDTTPAMERHIGQFTSWRQEMKKITDKLHQVKPASPE